ncbi:MAG TPA: hypothetical protein P5556_08985 [Candidatus Gastranaerophilales bacterium]|nr:hypothetical protein [Candidatus Gastranaerophilales bacterium]
MEKEKQLETIELIKKSTEQMKIDDIEENPESAYEEFQCDCCGEVKILAGSLLYKSFRLCNDCVLIAETGFALNKMTEIEDLLNKMEDKRFETLYNSIFNVEENSMN